MAGSGPKDGIQPTSALPTDVCRLRPRSGPGARRRPIGTARVRGAASSRAGPRRAERPAPRSSPTRRSGSSAPLPTGIPMNCRTRPDMPSGGGDRVERKRCWRQTAVRAIDAEGHEVARSRTSQGRMLGPARSVTPWHRLVRLEALLGRSVRRPGTRLPSPCGRHAIRPMIVQHLQPSCRTIIHIARR